MLKRVDLIRETEQLYKEIEYIWTLEPTILQIFINRLLAIEGIDYDISTADNIHYHIELRDEWINKIDIISFINIENGC